MEETKAITITTIMPTLVFDGNTREAFDFYKSVFGAELSALLRYRDLEGASGVPAHELDRIAHITLPLGNAQVLMASDNLEAFRESVVVGNNFYIMIEPESAEDASRLFDALSDEGRVQMPLEATEWAEGFGQCVDRFGIQWMINYTGSSRSDGPAEGS
jgi:PhnB protein